KLQFEREGIFTYCHEENTDAYNIEDNDPEDEKRKRSDEIMELQSGTSYELNQEKVRKTLKEFFEIAEGDYFIGRTEFDSPEVDNEVLVKKSEAYVRLGDFANVEITSADHYDLYGKVKEIKN